VRLGISVAMMVTDVSFAQRTGYQACYHIANAYSGCDIARHLRDEGVMKILKALMITRLT